MDTWNQIVEELQHFQYDDDYELHGFPNQKEQQAAWYNRNKERILEMRKQYIMDNKEEINRKRRERRNTEPYRSQYLARQRERRRNK